MNFESRVGNLSLTIRSCVQGHCKNIFMQVNNIIVWRTALISHMPIKFH